MPFQVHESVDLAWLANANYGFFTNEDGSSSAGYIVNGKNTRNVNLYSSQNPSDLGYDSADSVVGNLMRCFAELTHGREQLESTHKFIMTSNYGAGGAKVLSCKTIEELVELKRKSAADQPALKLDSKMAEQLMRNQVYAVKADALVFKGVPGQLVAAGGASGDAHPIVLIDDANKVTAYISGAHAALKAGVIEETIEQMVGVGAARKNIHLIIGPGLGKNSYEFGLVKKSCDSTENLTPSEYLNVPGDKVLDVKAEGKWLVDIEKLVCFKAMGLVPPENIHNMDIDTMGFDLYKNGARKTEVNFSELNEKGLLFFGARRQMMEKCGLRAEEPGLHNTVGRHFAGITVRG